MPTLTINNEQITVEDGLSILQAAEKMGIKIPTLCYHKALSPYGACRLCVVEIKRNGSSIIKTSCTYPALDGLVVETNSERVIRNRKIMIELLLARCPDADDIKALAKELGVDKIRIKSKASDCTLCGLCVRMCSERMGRGAINFIGRGISREVTSPFGQPTEVCQICGACDFVCPTGRINLESLSGRKSQPILSEYNAALIQRSAVYIPYPQAIPNKATIDPRYCVHLKTGECQICKDLCEAEAIDYNQKEEKKDIDVGALILAPGYDLFDPKDKFEYGYLEYPNVITALEFERILSASGPYKGHVLRPSDQKPPKKAAFIQCVGSRDKNHDYCSAVCCMFSIKEAIIAKEHEPDVEPAIFYMDIRSYGKEFDRYYERAKNEYGIRFVRARVSDIEKSSVDGGLTLKYENSECRMILEDFDLVVLAVGFQGFGRLDELRKKLNLPLNKFGFIASDSFSTVETKLSGIYICGPAQEPQDIPSTVVQASAAASAVGEVLKDVRWKQIKEKEYPPERSLGDGTKRIGVFICHCGINIGGVVNVPEVVEYIKCLPDVYLVEHNLYTCSQDTQIHIKEVIVEHKLNRIIVASCTPRTHEPLFQETIREAGLNRHLFSMANIRDQCSWVHMRFPLEATEKAKDLVRMAVSKVRLAEPLPKLELDVTQSALVIGGGVAGLSSAISLARQGFPVDIVERESVLGGNLSNIKVTLDGKETGLLLNKLLMEIKKSENIKVHLKSQVKEVTGFIGNYKTTIQKEDKSDCTIEHGVAVIATGATESVPTEYLYGKDPKVKTNLEYEKYILEVSPDKLPDSVVFIQCVGSREEEHMYCSKICCKETVKNALLLKKKKPDSEIYVLYRDIRTYGFSESYYRKAREAGIIFLRYEASNKPEVEARDKKLSIKVMDITVNSVVNIHTDMVVLAARIDPRPENDILSQHFKLPLTADRYFLEAHVKLRPVDFASEGVYLAGMAHSPMTIAESIAQGKAAAARAATIISKDKYEAEATIAQADEEVCIGCGLCVSLCDYNALEVITTRQGKKVIKINQIICKACGGCAAICPSGAMQQKGFKSKQVIAEINAALL